MSTIVLPEESDAQVLTNGEMKLHKPLDSALQGMLPWRRTRREERVKSNRVLFCGRGEGRDSVAFKEVRARHADLCGEHLPGGGKSWCKGGRKF